MQQVTYDELRQELGHLFDFNPPPLVPDPKSSSICPKLGSPPSFYEKHLDDRLTLKRVVLMPSITTQLSETVDKTLRYLERQKIRLPSQSPMNGFPKIPHTSSFIKHPIDASSVARAYRGPTAVQCMTIASMLFLSPRASQWDTTLNWTQGFVTGPESHRAFEEDCALKLLDIPGTSSDPLFTIPNNIWDSMEHGIRERLSQVAERFSTLAVWQIFAISEAAEHSMADMSRIADLQTFPYEKCQTTWHSAAVADELPYVPDATTTSWGVPVPTLTENPRTSECPPSVPPLEVGQVSSWSRTLRRTGNKVNPDPAPPERSKAPDKRRVRNRTMTGHLTSDETWSPVTVSRSSSTTTCLTTSLLQCAWSRSVLKDSTFIIFHCGNFERIGFRHRATQTLFLSELINIPNCKDPGYGKLHTGLYISILHDVLERVSQQCSYEQENLIHFKRHRQAQASYGIPAKRPKTRAYVAKELKDGIDLRKAYDLVRKEASTRHVVLIQLRYKNYNSPAPASFLRVGKLLPTTSQTYAPDQYISLLVGSDIAGGATGIVHNASLEVFASDGVHRLKVVVKFALEPQQQARLRHEFSIYEHLASSEVKGIPYVFGLFQDTESDTLALVMTHVGVCLVDREPKALKTVVRDPERAAFIRVMEDIHRAGVRHHDPRVENLMVQDDGNVAIIDFDRAELDASERSKAREMLYLQDILDGLYPSRDGWQTEETSKASDTDSFTGKRRWSDSGSETE